MPRATLITLHYLQSKRKAGPHWLAESLWQDGWDVLFMTGALSWLSWLRRDFRFNYPVRREAGRLVTVRPNLTSFVWFTPYHPGNLRAGWLNQLASPLFRRYGSLSLGPAEQHLAGSDLVIFDSTPALLLFDRVRELAPAARLVYRVSDDLRMLRNHPVVLRTEERIAPLMDLVSVPSATIYKHFAHLPNARLDHHGIRKDLFDQPRPNPYTGHGPPNAVFVGNSHVDLQFLDAAARLRPDWTFHVIGPIDGLPTRSNLIAYGERPFDETIAYLQHADVGLQCRSYIPGAESLSDSLKVIQYTYCKLPVIAPEFLRGDRPNIVYYRPGDESSIEQALDAALTIDRAAIPIADIRSWDDLARSLAGPAAIPALAAR